MKDLPPKILRPLGIIVGILFVVFGSILLINPIYNDLKEKLGAISIIITGIFFVTYGIKGRKKE